MKKVVILVADWEMQCCGIPFKAGDSVSWEIAEIERKYKKDFLKKGIIHLDYFYDAHGQRKSCKASGTILKIQTVYALYKLNYNIFRKVKKCYVPVSYKVLDFEGEADGWEKDIEKYRFCAYLVHLECENDILFTL